MKKLKTKILLTNQNAKGKVTQRIYQNAEIEIDFVYPQIDSIHSHDRIDCIEDMQDLDSKWEINFGIPDYIFKDEFDQN